MAKFMTSGISAGDIETDNLFSGYNPSVADSFPDFLKPVKILTSASASLA